MPTKYEDLGDQELNKLIAKRLDGHNWIDRLIPLSYVSDVSNTWKLIDTLCERILPDGDYWNVCLDVNRQETLCVINPLHDKYRAEARASQPGRAVCIATLRALDQTQ